MKRQPDERKIKGCWYVKREWHRFCLQKREEQRDQYKKELDDLQSAFNFCVTRSKQF